MDLALGGGFNKPFEGDLTSLDGPPDFCSGDGKREVDEFEGTSDVPVFVTDFLGCDSGDVISAEDAQGGVHVEVTCDHHEGACLSISRRPIAEMFAGDPVLDVKIKAVGDFELDGRQEQGSGTDPRAFRVKRTLSALR